METVKNVNDAHYHRPPCGEVDQDNIEKREKKKRIENKGGKLCV